MELAGKSVLLTGATGGLGRAIAEALAERGANLVLSSRKEEELAKIARELPGDHRVEVSDLGEPGAAEALAKAAGEVDCLVANAALPGTGLVTAYSPEEAARVLRVNLESAVLLSQALLPRMAEQDQGHLVFVASLSGKAASPRSSLYNATKFGLRGYALALREDLRRTGVGVSLVTPGFIREAGMFADSGVKTPPGMGTRSPRDVANAVVKAIENDRSEVTVAPRPVRALTTFALLLPEVAGRIAGGASTKTAEQLAERQVSKR